LREVVKNAWRLVCSVESHVADPRSAQERVEGLSRSMARAATRRLACGCSGIANGGTGGSVLNVKQSAGTVVPCQRSEPWGVPAGHPAAGRRSVVFSHATACSAKVPVSGGPCKDAGSNMTRHRKAACRSVDTTERGRPTASTRRSQASEKNLRKKLVGPREVRISGMGRPNPGRCCPKPPDQRGGRILD